MNNNNKKEKQEKKYNHYFHMNMIYFSSIGYNHNFDYKNFKKIKLNVNTIQSNNNEFKKSSR